jgi:hypothetical protein
VVSLSLTARGASMPPFFQTRFASLSYRFTQLLYDVPSVQRLTGATRGSFAVSRPSAFTPELTHYRGSRAG